MRDLPFKLFDSFCIFAVRDFATSPLARKAVVGKFALCTHSLVALLISPARAPDYQPSISWARGEKTVWIRLWSRIRLTVVDNSVIVRLFDNCSSAQRLELQPRQIAYTGTSDVVPAQSKLKARDRRPVVVYVGALQVAAQSTWHHRCRLLYRFQAPSTTPPFEWSRVRPTPLSSRRRCDAVATDTGTSPTRAERQVDQAAVVAVSRISCWESATLRFARYYAHCSGSINLLVAAVIVFQLAPPSELLNCCLIIRIIVLTVALC